MAVALESLEVLNQSQISVLLLDCQDRAVVPTASWFEDSHLQPFTDVLLDLLSVGIGYLDLLLTTWWCLRTRSKYCLRTLGSTLSPHRRCLMMNLSFCFVSRTFDCSRLTSYTADVFCM